MQQYVKDNRVRINARRNETGIGRDCERRRRARIRKLVQEYKEERPCHDCHNKFPHYVTEFDHARGSKRFNIGSLHTLVWSIILKELAKCDLVCANCHKIRSHKRNQFGRK